LVNPLQPSGVEVLLCNKNPFSLRFFNFIQATVTNFSKGKSATQSNKIPFGQYLECPEKMREAPQHFERKFLANINRIGVYKGI
jgi:hypothetical protein